MKTFYTNCFCGTTEAAVSLSLISFNFLLPDCFLFFLLLFLEHFQNVDRSPSGTDLRHFDRSRRLKALSADHH